MRMYDYDLVVIGSGPGGQKAAIAGAKLGKSVARRRTRLDARRRLRQHRFGRIRYPQRSAPHSNNRNDGY
jgi:flavin-dependent dehydrogenase